MSTNEHGRRIFSMSILCHLHEFKSFQISNDRGHLTFHRNTNDKKKQKHEKTRKSRKKVFIFQRVTTSKIVNFSINRVFRGSTHLFDVFLVF